MKVSSPVGDLPFEASRIRWKDGAFVVEGAMGAWPATIRIYPRDAPMLLRLLRWPLAALAAVIVALIVIAVVV
jgi:hypothetical protein